jgi:L-aspartate oxidase
MFRLDERVQTTDFLIIGAGVAGLRAAIALAAHGDVLVVTKESLGESNTHYAQGGIAVATEGQEDVALHLVDTIAAGDGLVYEPAAAVLVEEGPERVAELIEWGAAFDRKGGELLRTREAAHSHPRILHANGDATGAEISRSLVAFARSHPRIQFAEWTMASSLILSEAEETRAVSEDQSAISDDHRAMSDGQSAISEDQSVILDGRRAIGAELMSAGLETGAATDCGSRCRVFARAVLLASGGAGQVYSDTTNPAVATGDGIALAARAGAELADMEFYQFHPTALSLPGVARFLLSEALRGEGAYLRNDRGERFMERYHPSLELAPRDVVARAIAREGMGASSGDSRPVYLDMRHVTGIDLTERFPGISRFLASHGLSLATDLIPVRPAAHYMMGGIRTDLDGRTSVRGLYAAGEAACTGVHGANRLASNSLLEGLVFGARAAEAIVADALPLVTEDSNAVDARDFSANDAGQVALEIESDVAAIVKELRAMMWQHAGLLRDREGLLTGFDQLWSLLDRFEGLKSRAQTSRALVEADALFTVAMGILESALERRESRGAHFREDYPRRNDPEFGMHSILEMDGLLVRFEPLG